MSVWDLLKLVASEGLGFITAKDEGLGFVMVQGLSGFVRVYLRLKKV